MREFRVINLTDTTIHLYPEEYTDIPLAPVKNSDIERVRSRCIVLQPSGKSRVQISRDSEKISIRTDRGEKKKIQIAYTHMGVISGIPEQQDGVIYIVSQLAYNSAHRIRKDIYLIDKPIRAESGLVVACRGFARAVYDEDLKQLTKVENYLRGRFAILDKSTESDKVLECIQILSRYKES